MDNGTANRLALIGTCFTDIKGYPDGIYDPVGRNVGMIEYFCGGVARNVAQNCSVIGKVVRFVSMCDAGAAGDAMLEELSKNGVDLSGVIRPEKGGCGVWLAVMDERGQVAGSISQQPDVDMLERHVRSLGDGILDACGALLLEIDLSPAIAEYCVGMAERRGVPVYVIVGNLSVLRQKTELLSRCRCLICNEAEAGALIGNDFAGLDENVIAADAARWADSVGLPPFVVTLGSRGAVCCDRMSKSTGCVPAVETTVVDTTGAGDAFFSACVCALTDGLTLVDACRRGASAAACVISSKENALKRE